MAESCRSCISYQAIDTVCRFNPPVAFAVPQPGGKIGFMGIFPPIQPTGWCRKYERDPQIPAEEERPASPIKLVSP